MPGQVEAGQEVQVVARHWIEVEELGRWDGYIRNCLVDSFMLAARQLSRPPKVDELGRKITIEEGLCLWPFASKELGRLKPRRGNGGKERGFKMKTSLRAPSRWSV